ncbi:MAG: nucleotidyltransferase domain-containing protein [archaeon]
MKKEKWEIATEKFLKYWKEKKEVIGAVVCGSYLFGDASANSDIDIQIVLDKKVKWRERGNRIVDGFLIEYFANPPKQIIKYFEEDLRDNTHMAPNMFLTGKVLFDKKGEVKKLVKTAKEFKRKKFTKMGNINKELEKYATWDRIDNIEDSFKKNSPDFYYIYFEALKRMYETYARFLGEPISGTSKTFDVLNKEKTRKKYLLKKFKDQKFTSLFIDTMQISNKNTMMKKINKLKDHVFKRMGGFNIDGWKINSEIEK